MLQLCAVGTSANRRRAKQLLWISNQLIDKHGTKYLYRAVCLGIWVSHIVVVWTDIMHVPVCAHGTAPSSSECVFLMPQWKWVYICAKSENPLPCSHSRVWERVFIKRLWVVLLVSFTHSQKKGFSPNLLSLEENHMILQPSHNHYRIMYFSV